MRSSGNVIGKDRESLSSQAEKQECNPCYCKNSLFIVGLGPGNPQHLSEYAHHVLESVDSIVGYSTYIELIRDHFPGKHFVQSSMKKEIERVNAAIELAVEGKSTAIVSSGDAGIYAMAGLAFELCRKKKIRIQESGIGSQETALRLEVVPGIPALCAGASLLGAPLTHDFAVISLSDLLTPWEVIERRIEAAAIADFVIVFYNPKSKKRNWQLKKAVEIILKHRSKDTPVGIVTSAMREDQNVVITMLGNTDVEQVNMQSIVFVGNKTTFMYQNYMVTPRGYSDKYDMGDE